MPCDTADLTVRYQRLLAEGERPSRRFCQLFNDCHLALHAERTQRQREAQKAETCIQQERAKVDRKEKELESLRTTKWEFEQQPAGELFSAAMPSSAFALLEKGNGGKPASSRQLTSERAAEDEVRRLGRVVTAREEELRLCKAKFLVCTRQLEVATKALEKKLARIEELEAQVADAPPAAKSLSEGGDVNLDAEAKGLMGDIEDARGGGGVTDDDNFQSEDEEEDAEDETQTWNQADVSLLLRQKYTENGPIEGHDEDWYVTFNNDKGMFGGAATTLDTSPYHVALVHGDFVYFDFDCGKVVDKSIQSQLINDTKQSPNRLIKKMFTDKAIASIPDGVTWHNARAFGRELSEVTEILRIPRA